MDIPTVMRYPSSPLAKQLRAFANRPEWAVIVCARAAISRAARERAEARRTGAIERDRETAKLARAIRRAARSARTTRRAARSAR